MAIDRADGLGPVRLTQGRDYTVTALGNNSLANGGNVTLSTSVVAGLPGGAWSVGQMLLVLRTTLKAQASSFGSIDYLSPAAVEASDDNLERQIQEIDAALSHAVFMSRGEPGFCAAAGGRAAGRGALFRSGDGPADGRASLHAERG